MSETELEPDLKHLDEYDYLLPIFEKNKSEAWEKMAKHILEKFVKSFNECIEAAKTGDKETVTQKRDEIVSLFDDQQCLMIWLMVNDHHRQVLTAIRDTLGENKNYEKMFYRLIARLMLVFENYERGPHVSESEEKAIYKVYDLTGLSMEDLADIFNRSKATIYRVVSE